MINEFFIYNAQHSCDRKGILIEVIMQVPPLPTPAVPTAMPQEAAAKAVPQVQAQAAAPVIQRAVDPAPKSEKGNQSRTNGEKAGAQGNSGKRGGSVNIRV